MRQVLPGCTYGLIPKIRLLRAHTVVGRALARRKRALTHVAQQPRHAAIGSTTDQMSTEAALAVMRALWMGIVTCSELPGSLLIQTVCRVSGVYSECARLSFVFIHAIEGQHRKACHQRNYIEIYSKYNSLWRMARLLHTSHTYEGGSGCASLWM